MKKTVRCIPAIILLLTIFIFNRCQLSMDPVSHKWVQTRYVVPSGKLISKDIPVSDFSGINIKGIDVELYQDTVNSVTMVGDSSLLSLYSAADVDSGGILSVNPEEYTIAYQPIPGKLIIRMIDIDYIRMENNTLIAATPIKCRKLRMIEISKYASLSVTCDSLRLDLCRDGGNAPGLTLKGNCGYTWVALRDGANLTAPSFKSNSIDILRAPSSTCLVNPLNFQSIRYGPKPNIDYSAK